MDDFISFGGQGRGGSRSRKKRGGNNQTGGKKCNNKPLERGMEAKSTSYSNTNFRDKDIMDQTILSPLSIV